MARVDSLTPNEMDQIYFAPLRQALTWLEFFVHTARLVYLDPQWRTHNTIGARTDWWHAILTTGDPTSIDMRIKISAARRPSSVHPLSRIVELMEIYPSWGVYTARPWFEQLLRCLQSFHITDLHVEFPEAADEDGWFVFTATWGIDSFLRDCGLSRVLVEADDFFPVTARTAL